MKAVLIIFVLTSFIVPITTQSAQENNSSIEYCIGVSYTDNPWQELGWIERLSDLDIDWIRTDIVYRNKDEPMDFIKYLDDQGFKILGIFSRKLAPWVDDGFENIMDLNSWRVLVQRALVNYGPFLSAIEVWNEPDLLGFQQGYMDGSPEHYFEMLRVLHEEVQAYNSSIKIVAGSVATLRNSETFPGDNYGGYFLQQIRDLGADLYCDAYSFHVYDWWLNGKDGIWSVADAYSAAKEIVGDKPVWVTEMGHAINDNQDQYLDQWLSELEVLESPFISYYSLYSRPFSLTLSNLEPSPGYYVFQTYVRKMKIQMLEDYLSTVTNEKFETEILLSNAEEENLVLKDQLSMALDEITTLESIDSILEIKIDSLANQLENLTSEVSRLNRQAGNDMSEETIPVLGLSAIIIVGTSLLVSVFWNWYLKKG